MDTSLAYPTRCHSCVRADERKDSHSDHSAHLRVVQYYMPVCRLRSKSDYTYVTFVKQLNSMENVT